MAENDNLIKQTNTLSKAVQDLASKVGIDETIAERTDIVEKKNDRTRRILIVTIIGLILDILLTFGFGYLFHRVDKNATTIQGVECRLYGTALSQADPNSPEAKAHPKQYQENYNLILKDFHNLGCDPKLLQKTTK